MIVLEQTNGRGGNANHVGVVLHVESFSREERPMIFFVDASHVHPTNSNPF